MLEIVDPAFSDVDVVISTSRKGGSKMKTKLWTDLLYLCTCRAASGGEQVLQLSVAFHRSIGITQLAYNPLVLYMGQASALAVIGERPRQRRMLPNRAVFEKGNIHIQRT